MKYLERFVGILVGLTWLIVLLAILLMPLILLIIILYATL